MAVDEKREMVLPRKPEVLEAIKDREGVLQVNGITRRNLRRQYGISGKIDKTRLQPLRTYATVLEQMSEPSVAKRMKATV